MNRRPELILIAGGGTGGHVFPGIAVADALRAIADVDVAFCGTPRGIESHIVPQKGYRLELLDVEPMKGGGVQRAVRGGLVAARETVRAVSLLRRLAPRAVLSVGGYAAGPVALAAAALRVPLAVLEPNSTIGLANKLLAPVASRAYVAWRGVAGEFRAGRARLYGVPIREGFEPRPLPSHERRARVLVMGGSQGASALNERIPLVFADRGVESTCIEVLHQAGASREAAVREAYARVDFQRARVVGFLEDVAGELARADLVIARAGAATVAEISAVGRPSILIPFPHAADDHQAKNAMALAELGGACFLRQEAATIPRIAQELTRIACDPELRARMADASRAHGRPRAAFDVAQDLLALAGIAARVEPGSGITQSGQGNGYGHGFAEVP
jgi:UDP-N-acetylglucosamine--N-acetylmuramyl-(pentapeptide) pyrophosphoryl-undecaprenol N-acetylglucosamine transferase